MVRVSDVTLSDFWNIKKYKPDFYDDMGVSRVLINTEKGKELFEKLKTEAIITEVDMKNCEEVEQFIKPESVDPEIGNIFLKNYEKNSRKMFDDMYRKARIRKSIGSILRTMHLR